MAHSENRGMVPYLTLPILYRSTNLSQAYKLLSPFYRQPSPRNQYRLIDRPEESGQNKPRRARETSVDRHAAEQEYYPSIITQERIYRASGSYVLEDFALTDDCE